VHSPDRIIFQRHKHCHQRPAVAGPSPERLGDSAVVGAKPTSRLPSASARRDQRALRARIK
jgi:hypothetical protein